MCCLWNNNRKKLFRAIRLTNEKKSNIVTTKPEASICSEMPTQSIQLKNSSIMRSSSVITIKTIDMAIDKISFSHKPSISISIPKAKRTNSSILANSPELSHQSHSPCTPVTPQLPNIMDHTNDEITAINFKKIVILVELDSKKAYNNISTCLICQENFNEDNKVRALPCGHPYHEKCVYKSFIIEKKKQCLNCLKLYS